MTASYSRMIRLADKFVETLAAAPNPDLTNIVRDYLPVTPLEDMANSGADAATVKIYVTPKGEAAAIQNRNRAQQADRDLYVCFCHKMIATRGTDAYRDECDAILDYIEVIKWTIRTSCKTLGVTVLSISDEYVLSQVIHDPLYDPKFLDEHNELRSLVTVRYRTSNEPASVI